MKNALGRGWWTLERFGLSPAKLGRRLTTHDGPRVFCITVPKAGTHLLERALCLHPALARKLLPTVRSNNVARLGGLEGIARGLRPGQVAMSHLHHTPDHAEILSREGLVTIFLIRDPRDIVVSEAVYLAHGDRRHRLHPMFASQPDAKDRILAAKGLSTPSGERGMPTRIRPISSSAQKRRISRRAASSLRRSSVTRGVASVPEASEVASPIRFSPKSTARMRIEKRVAE